MSGLNYVSIDLEIVISPILTPPLHNKKPPKIYYLWRFGSLFLHRPITLRPHLTMGLPLSIIKNN